MKKNVGKVDKIVRIVLGVILGVAALFLFTGVWQIILGILSGAMFFTAITGSCYFYTLLGINTCKLKK